MKSRKAPEENLVRVHALNTWTHRRRTDLAAKLALTEDGRQLGVRLGLGPKPQRQVWSPTAGVEIPGRRGRFNQATSLEQLQLDPLRVHQTYWRLFGDYQEHFPDPNTVPTAWRFREHCGRMKVGGLIRSGCVLGIGEENTIRSEPELHMSNYCQRSCFKPIPALDVEIGDATAGRIESALLVTPTDGRNVSWVLFRCVLYAREQPDTPFPWYDVIYHLGGTAHLLPSWCLGPRLILAPHPRTRPWLW